MEGKINCGEIPPITLAYLGDAVFELCVRNYLVKTKRSKVNNLHKEAKRYVSASAQAKIAYCLDEYWTDEERKIFKRGRNATSHTVPKNADVVDYRHATGLEAVFGYLYMEGSIDRISELFNMIRLEIGGQDGKK